LLIAHIISKYNLDLTRTLVFLFYKEEERSIQKFQDLCGRRYVTEPKLRHFQTLPRPGPLQHQRKASHSANPAANTLTQALKRALRPPDPKGIGKTCHKPPQSVCIWSATPLVCTQPHTDMHRSWQERHAHLFQCNLDTTPRSYKIKAQLQCSVPFVNRLPNLQANTHTASPKTPHLQAHIPILETSHGTLKHLLHFCQTWIPTLVWAGMLISSTARGLRYAHSFREASALTNSGIAMGSRAPFWKDPRLPSRIEFCDPPAVGRHGAL